MTSTTPTITPPAGDAGRAGPGTAPGIAALIAEANRQRRRITVRGGGKSLGQQ